MSAGAKVLPIDRERFRYKMKDLSDATGLDRQAIHFYIQQGLLPPGHKTGRNMAWYAEQHLERLFLIKKLQHERFLPLKAIKALLDGRAEAFAPEQQQFLHNVRDKIDASLSSRGPVERVLVSDLVRRDADGGETAEPTISADDAWLFDALGELRTLGFTKERGFTVADVAFYHEAMSGMFRQEVGLLSSRLSHLPPDQAARMIERAIPIVNQTLSRLHTQLVREFFGDSF